MTNVLQGFLDSDYMNCLDISCSILGYCFSLSSGVISWRSRRLNYATDSICYAEYITPHGASQEAIFLQQLL